MRPSSRSMSFAGLAVGALLVAAACSSAGSTPVASVLGATATPAPAAGLTLASSSTTALGEFLTGNNGMTLYVFTKDSPDKATCTGQCATFWPPLTVPAGTTVTGPASATKGFGTIQDADGSTQVTYNHMPLYYFAKDTKAGDTTGQGVQGVWFVASESGAIPTAAASPSTAAAGGSGLALAEMNTSLGTFLTGKNGMTLYFFTKDTPDKSTCTGQCATFWPPLTVPAGTTVTGPADATMAFGTITDADGSTQVTYNHLPLYYFAKDTKAGDTTGQGVQGVWFVASVSGSVSSAAPAGGAGGAQPSASAAYGY